MTIETLEQSIAKSNAFMDEMDKEIKILQKMIERCNEMTKRLGMPGIKKGDEPWKQQ